MSERFSIKSSKNWVETVLEDRGGLQVAGLGAVVVVGVALGAGVLAAGAVIAPFALAILSFGGFLLLQFGILGILFASFTLFFTTAWAITVVQVPALVSLLIASALLLLFAAGRRPPVSSPKPSAEEVQAAQAAEDAAAEATADADAARTAALEFEVFDRRLERRVGNDATHELSVNDVGTLLSSIGCGEHSEVFAREGIDGRALVALTQSDLQTLGVTRLGDLRKIEAARDKLK